MRRICGGILTAVLLSASMFVGSQGMGQRYSERRIPLMSERDNDQTANYEYCTTTGIGDIADAPERVENSPALTSGSSTTVTAVTSGSGPFRFIAAGDELFFQAMATPLPFSSAPRYVSARASEDSITVNSAIDLTSTGKYFTWRKLSCGTASTSGWINVAGHSFLVVSTQVEQSDAGIVDMEIQCELQGSASNPVRIYQKSYATPFSYPGNRDLWKIDFSEVPADRCRVGFKLDADASDAGANLEKITAYARLADYR